MLPWMIKRKNDVRGFWGREDPARRVLAIKKKKKNTTPVSPPKIQSNLRPHKHARSNLHGPKLQLRYVFIIFYNGYNYNP